MFVQFLIPWFLVAKLTLTRCQQQPPGYFDQQHFQNLFTHPTLPSQIPFDGFRGFHNPPMPAHYELFANSGHVMNPNLVHPPHPFFQLHPHPFPTTMSVPFTTTKPHSRKTRATTIIHLSTPLIIESTKTVEVTTPQASKPVVESVRIYAPENELDHKLQQALNTLEKMNNPDVSRKPNKLQNFPTPSSTVLPNAHQIDNQTEITMTMTTNISTTTTQSSSSTTTTSTTTTTQLPSSTTTTTQLPSTETTTNLPKKIFDKAEKAAQNGEKLDLIRHLNTSDLESFLRSANLSTNEAQNFLRLVEKVLEEELQKRLNTKRTIENDQSEGNVTLSDATVRASISATKPTEPIIRPPSNNEGHEVKTVNTRLNYESPEIDQTTNTNHTTEAHVTDYSQHSSGRSSLVRSHLNPNSPRVGSLDEVRKREQEEFDRLLGKIVLESSSSETGSSTEEPVDQDDDGDLLPYSVTRFVTQAPLRNNHRQTTPHQPKTAFQQLVQDYQYRLSGNDGFNDLIKALRNAHISFFERTAANRRGPKVKIAS